MPLEYHKNIQKLIIFIENLLAPEINITTLDKMEKLIFEFVEELEDLYPHKIMLSGIHELLHLVDCVRDFGPLNGINLFHFEEDNRKLIRFIHGMDLIGEELIKLLTTAQHLAFFANKVVNLKLKKFISARLGFKSSNNKQNALKKLEFCLCGKPIVIKDAKILLTLEKAKISFTDNLKEYSKVSVGNIDIM